MSKEAMELALEALVAAFQGKDKTGQVTDAITAIRKALAEQPAQELLAWKNAAIRVGEELSSVGPNGYYNMTADQWLAWAMDQQPRGKSSLAEQPAQPQEPVAAAMGKVIEALQQDPGYAWGWHCNIAMAFVDAGGDHYTSNQGAARFMKLLANVEPAHELPSPPAQRKPLTDECLFDIADEYKSEYKHGGQRYDEFDFKGYARAIEAAHGIKENT